MRALQMDVRARVLAGDPFALARRKRDLAVDRQRELERDARAAELAAGSSQPASDPPRRLAPDADLHLDACIAQRA